MPTLSYGGMDEDSEEREHRRAATILKVLMVRAGCGGRSLGRLTSAAPT